MGMLLHDFLILVNVPCECITGNIAQGHGREPIKHELSEVTMIARSRLDPGKLFKSTVWNIKYTSAL